MCVLLQPLSETSHDTMWNIFKDGRHTVDVFFISILNLHRTQILEQKREKEKHEGNIQNYHRNIVRKTKINSPTESELNIFHWNVKRGQHIHICVC